jgi:LemA protein
VVIGIVVVAAVIVLAAAYLIGKYNKLIRRRNQVENAWAQIDVQLKRRYDLVPNLVESAKGYASHERDVFQAVTSARASAVNATGPVEQAQADNLLTGALKSLFAVAEAYPDLKASAEFLELQEQLEDTENKIAYARQYYNDAVLGLDNAISTFPTNVLAGMMGFHHVEAFQATRDESGPVRVQF